MEELKRTRDFVDPFPTTGENYCIDSFDIPFVVLLSGRFSPFSSLLFLFFLVFSLPSAYFFFFLTFCRLFCVSIGLETELLSSRKEHLFRVDAARPLSTSKDGKHMSRAEERGTFGRLVETDELSMEQTEKNVVHRRWRCFFFFGFMYSCVSSFYVYFVDIEVS